MSLFKINANYIYIYIYIFFFKKKEINKIKQNIYLNIKVRNIYL